MIPEKKLIFHFLERASEKRGRANLLFTDLGIIIKAKMLHKSHLKA